MDGCQDLYAQLGVAPQAEADVIRAAYRVLAQRYHRDRVGAGQPALTARMAAINQAYAVLSCPERHRAYDVWRRDLHRMPTHASPPASAATRQALARPSVLTTYDRRGRLHAYL